MQTLSTINYIIMILFMICYAYQFIYIPISWIPKNKIKKKTILKQLISKDSNINYNDNLSSEPGTDTFKPFEPHNHTNENHQNINHYAVLICARNEETVIRDLIESIQNQTYPASHITTFVMADNCTDHTAFIAKQAGAVVYTRFNTELIGKGYATKALLQQIRVDYPEGFDGYFIFDADNILSRNYIEEMHKTFLEGHDIITSYRNSKNYGSNWISAGYGLWFLRESRYLNYTRDLIGTSCAVSGTGYMFSRAVAEDIDGWPFHMLTEDLEFTADQVVKGRKIAFCKAAEFYDEQPLTFRQSWNQRMRWAQGYLQVFHRYGLDLIKGAFHGSFSCFDMAMSIMPAFILSIFSILCNLVLSIWGASIGDNIWIAISSIGEMLGNMYLTLFLIGAVTTLTEWKHIHTSSAKKLLYMVTFPFFMFTYIPISVASLFVKPAWKPIKHTCSVRVMENYDYEALKKAS